MFTSLHTVTGSSARYCTIQDRGDVWPSAAATDHILPDFGGLAEGLLAGRLVATDSGWRKVETLAPGDMVLTFDHGMRRLESIDATAVTPDPRQSSVAQALHVPKGAIGNRRAITLLPSQLVLLDCDFAQARYGDPFLLVQAGLLDGYNEIVRAPLPAQATSYMLTFAQEEIIHTDGSALMSCYGRRTTSRLARPGRYPRMTRAQALEFRRWVNLQARGQDPSLAAKIGRIPARASDMVPMARLH